MRGKNDGGERNGVGKRGSLGKGRGVGKYGIGKVVMKGDGWGEGEE